MTTYISPNENGILSHISKIYVFQQRLSLYPKKRQPPAGRMPLWSLVLDLKSAQFLSLRLHLRARLIDVQKKSIFETVKRLKQ
eukprot:scaffold20371_cov46-Cyclotella_meneghiniana.AAC.2